MKESSPESGLARLISPLSVESFFSDFYGRVPFHLESREMTEYPFLTLEDILVRIRCLELRFNQDYSVVRNGEVLAPMFQKSLATNRNWLPKLISEGWTLILNTIDGGYFPMHALAGDLIGDLTSEVNVNTYYTPADSRGYVFHRDQHDVFLWQQVGRKKWKVMALGAHEDHDEPLLEIILEPGQLLYIPENCRHAGTTCEDEDSLHLTIGYLSRYSQAGKVLARRANSWAGSEKIIRDLNELNCPPALPEGQTGLKKAEVLAALDRFREHLAEELPDEVDVLEFQEKIETPFTVEGVIRSLSDFNAEDEFSVVQKGAVIRREEKPGVTYSLPSGKMHFKEEFLGALEMVATTSTVRVGELPLESDDGAALCRLLVGSGVLKSVG